MTGETRDDLARLLTGRAEDVAPRLLGHRLLAGSTDGDVVLRITEVEAYAGVGEDPGSHAHRGRRPRTTSMFGPPGLLYVYFTYGMHWCANVVAHPVAPDGEPGTADGPAGAVLVRAGEVLDGHDLARRRRPTAARDVDLARGPARLTSALGVTGADDGTDLLDVTSRVRLLPPSAQDDAVVAPGNGPRVGVAGYGAVTAWRWWDARSPTVSAYRAARPRSRSTRTGTKGPAAGGAP